MVFLHENFFSAQIMRFFGKKRNFWTLEKLENMMKKKFFFEKKNRFHLLKLNLYQIGKAQNMAVVAGRLVKYSILWDRFLQQFNSLCNFMNANPNKFSFFCWNNFVVNFWFSKDDIIFQFSCNTSTTKRQKVSKNRL